MDKHILLNRRPLFNEKKRSSPESHSESENTAFTLKNQPTNQQQQLQQEKQLSCDLQK